MEINIEEIQIFLRVLIAFACGAVMGAERQWTGKPAGIATYSLVAVGTALFTHLGLEVATAYRDSSPDLEIMLDPSRVINAVMIGVSFLGAGTIIKRENASDVENLGTAAALLVIAGVGVAAMVENYTLAILITLLAIIIHRGTDMFKNASSKMDNRSAHEARKDK